ncbi:hypothetical protein LS70_003820 [Helicobacter sp. MIT 11-5569]|uniref:hypothetical protein n=1 Tax=Helicobacter sp. MIT 11-5569 TaxID=1548151 RepID=UPI00051FA012|nr:hypothetical protein [Helicobacter sp. MIT 11-5569]TLD83946.1 hypothetical protein LS70_003820 [Helicobacter sp. MIT 11-5569]
MSCEDSYAIESYLRTRFYVILKDKQRDEKLQEYLCSFVLVYWDSIVKTYSKDIVTFLSRVFGVSIEMIKIYLEALEEYKNVPDARNACLSVKINRLCKVRF